MADPFQTQSKQQSAATSRPVLRDTAEDKLLKPRPRKMIRAIKMLDVLTAGDEQLYEYLKAQQAEAAKRVEQAKEDMEMAETPEEAAEFAPDPMDELMAQDVPAVNSQLFQELKDAMMARCRDEVKLAFKVGGITETLLSKCNIPGCRIHSFSFTGYIDHHFRPFELEEAALRKADVVLNTREEVSYIEVRKGSLLAVMEDGSVEPI